MHLQGSGDGSMPLFENSAGIHEYNECIAERFFKARLFFLFFWFRTMQDVVE
eukprot:m.231532 g.231532  ORF g.231532 m.231532 type:complete len:52 (-) comp19267_c0_seq19:902-1057(-)